jgi:hypothetical protein
VKGAGAMTNLEEDFKRAINQIENEVIEDMTAVVNEVRGKLTFGFEHRDELKGEA